MTSSGDGNNSHFQKSQQRYHNVLTPKINQDSFKVIKAFPEGTKPFNWLFGVFDGHGGHKCAEYIKENFHNNIIMSNEFPSNI